MTPSQLAQLARAQAGHGRDSHEPWANAISTHPLDDLTANAHTLLLSPDMLTDVELEHAYQRRVVGYHETIRARRPTAGEHASLQIGAADPVLVMTRITRTHTPDRRTDPHRPQRPL